MDNMNLLNEMISQYIELGEQTGTSQIVNNTLKQIDQARSGRQKLKKLVNYQLEYVIKF